MGAEDQTSVFMLYCKQTTEPSPQPFWIIFKGGFQTVLATIFTPEMCACCGQLLVIISAAEHLGAVLPSFQRLFLHITSSGPFLWEVNY